MLDLPSVISNNHVLNEEEESSKYLRGIVLDSVSDNISSCLMPVT